MIRKRDYDRENMMNRFADTAVHNTQIDSGARLRARLHPRCVVCSLDHPCGLGLCFVPGADDTIMADFELDQTAEGYVGWSHGGIISAVLDGAMTNWLFAHGLTGVTGELNIRFRHPVLLGEPTQVTARLKSASHPLYELEAQITQNNQLKARATGRFMHTQHGGERSMVVDG
jgi:acyl-coenzyme A thioesterase PaaI-like protein